MPDIFIDKSPDQSAPHPRHHAMFPLASFADHPLGVHFSTQGDGEEIEMFLRRHFITNLPWIISTFLLMIAPPVVVPLLSPYLPIQIPTALSIVLIFFWYLAVLGGLFLTSFINWYFNVYIVTNERIIDVDFVNLLYREISSTRLNLIQDVTVRSGGVIRSIFHYGDVFIQTAGTQLNFDFHAVPEPEFAAHTIEKIMQEARLSEGRSELEESLEK